MVPTAATKTDRQEVNLALYLTSFFKMLSVPLLHYVSKCFVVSVKLVILLSGSGCIVLVIFFLFLDTNKYPRIEREIENTRI